MSDRPREPFVVVGQSVRKVDGVGLVKGNPKFVADTDLLHAAPSPATSLSVYELHYLLAKLSIRQLMSSPVITVGPDTPVEGAARSWDREELYEERMSRYDRDPD